MIATVLLSEITAGLPIDVVRDAPVRAPGYLSSQVDATLVSLYDPIFAKELSANPRIAAVLANQASSGHVPKGLGLALTVNPLDMLLQVHLRLVSRKGHYWQDFPSEISPLAIVHPKAYVAERNVRIGAGSRIGANASILENSLIGENCVIWPGVVIGADGFDARIMDGKMTVIPHSGGVRIGNGVHIQANSVIDRALFGGFTEIEDEVMIGSLVNIAHNARVGRRTRIVDTAMLAGSVSLGENCWIAPGAMVGAGVSVGADTSVGALSFVKSSLPANVRAWGTPAQIRN